MSEHGREILGRLSHWCLLGLGAAVLLCWGGIVIASAGTSHEDFVCKLVVPDTVSAASKDSQYIGGRLTGASKAHEVALYHVNGQGLRVSVDEDGRMLFKLPAGLPPGDYSVDIRGNPYSAIASARQTATLRVIPKVKRLYLLDTELALDAIKGDARQRAVLADAAVLMKAGGAVAAFYSGPLEEYQRVAQSLRACGWGEPVLWNDPAHPWRFVASIIWKLDLPESKVTILTRGNPRPPRTFDVRELPAAAAGEAIYEEISRH